MRVYINKAKQYLATHVLAKRWAWFVTLWLGGLLSVLLLASVLKFFMRLAGY